MILLKKVFISPLKLAISDEVCCLGGMVRQIFAGHREFLDEFETRMIFFIRLQLSSVKFKKFRIKYNFSVPPISLFGSVDILPRPSGSVIVGVVRLASYVVECVDCDE